MSWQRIGNIDLCTCQKCSWCRDAVVEMTEALYGRPSRIVEYVTSPLWYLREAARRYRVETTEIESILNGESK